MQVKSPPVDIHPGTFADLEKMHAIDDAASGVYAWGIDRLKRVYTKANITFLSSRIGNHIVAFVVFKQFRDHTGIVKIAVDPSWQRHGIGSTLVRQLARTLARKTLGVLVPEDMLEAQLFFRDKILMKYAGTQKGLFQEGNRDGYMMEVSVKTWTA